MLVWQQQLIDEAAHLACHENVCVIFTESSLLDCQENFPSPECKTSYPEGGGGWMAFEWDRFYVETVSI